MKRPAVFVDRDGTLNEQMGYINHISRFVLLPGTADAIRRLNRARYRTIVVSNQSGVARGYFPLELVNRVHDHMRALLEERGAVIDGIFFCPHYPGGAVKEFGIHCRCRKPGTGLIEQACERFEIDLVHSYVIGDRVTDMELAHRAGLKGILVLTGYGLGDREYVLPGSPYKPVHIAGNFPEAVDWLLEEGRS